MSRTACALLLVVAALAAVSAQGPNRAQQCIPLGGPLFSSCQPELNYVNQPSQYPLDSSTAPDDAKVKSVVDGLPSGLPSSACCTAVKKFDATGCGCESALSSTLKQLGYSSSPNGLAGVTKISATACKFTPYDCSSSAGGSSGSSSMMG